jgi:hypothetical protein
MKSKNADSVKPESQENKTTENVILVQPTVEELQNKISELESRLTSPKSLDEQIIYFQEKKQKIDDLHMFNYTRTTLTEAYEKTTKLANINDFENTEFRITLTNGTTKLFSLSNPIIIQNCIAFIIDAINVKIMELEGEISE